MADKLKVAVVGLGQWGRNLLRALRKVENAEVTAVCDSNLKTLAEASGIFPAPDNHVFADYTRMLVEADADAVVVATPPHTHFRFALLALKAGKHVFVEKPMALKFRPTELLEPYLGDRTFMVGHTFLYNDLVLEMKRLIDAGEIGEILYATGAWLNWGTVRSDVDTFWNFAPHPISILLYLFGLPPKAAYRAGSAILRHSIEDVSMVFLRFGEAVASVALSWLSPIKVRRLMVVGQKATIVFDDMARELRIVEGDSTRCAAFSTFGEFQLLRDAGLTIIPNVEYREPLQNEMQHFVDCCLSGQEPRTGFQHGAEVVRILENTKRM